MITTENVWSDEWADDYSPPPKWTGNRARLTYENAKPTVPLKVMSATSAYRVEDNWTFLGWCEAPYPSKTGCPTCLVFESEDGALFWTHCITEISIVANTAPTRENQSDHK